MAQVNNYIQPISASGTGDNGLTNQLNVTRQGHLEMEMSFTIYFPRTSTLQFNQGKHLH